MPGGFPLQDDGPGMNALFHDLAVEQEEKRAALRDQVADRKLSDAQRSALLVGEQALENLPTFERDDLIAKGLAVRAWPQITGAGWKTWLTEEGVRARLLISAPHP